jgi:hypothetical protein
MDIPIALVERQPSHRRPNTLLARLPLHQDGRLAESRRCNNEAEPLAQKAIQQGQKVFAGNESDLMNRGGQFRPYEPTPLVLSLTGSAARSRCAFHHRFPHNFDGKSTPTSSP